MPLFNGSLSQQIITSVIEPNNLVQGLIWNELDFNNNLVETWIRNSDKWFSALKEYSGGTGNSGVSFNEYLAIDTTRDIFIQSFIYHLYNQNSSNYASRTYLYREFASGSRLTLFQFDNNILSPNSRTNSFNKINTLYSPSSSDCLLVQILRTGTSTGTAFAGYKINYREVRR